EVSASCSVITLIRSSPAMICFLAQHLNQPRYFGEAISHEISNGLFVFIHWCNASKPNSSISGLFGALNIGSFQVTNVHHLPRSSGKRPRSAIKYFFMRLGATRLVGKDKRVENIEQIIIGKHPFQHTPRRKANV